MYFKHLQFDHEANNIHEGLHVPENIKTLVREKIIFSSMSNTLQAWELFEDEDDAPKELRTVTGDLSKALSLIDNDLEYSFMLLTFHDLHHNCKMFLAKHKAMNHLKNSEDREEYLKMQIISAIMELKDQTDKKESSDDEENDGPFTISDATMKKRMKLVKKSKHNFDTYFSMMKGENNNSLSSGLNIDDILGNLFNDKEGDD
jgi:hypothetical protein